MKVILAMDTSGTLCSVAVRRDGTVVAEISRKMDRGHTEALIPMVEAALAQSGVGYGDLTAVAVAVGPGSFTGIRTGIAAAHGFGISLAIPVIGVTTFEMAAIEAAARIPEAAEYLVALIETHRDDVYAAVLDRNLATRSEPVAVVPAELAAVLPSAPCFVTGSAAGRAGGLAFWPDVVVDTTAADEPGAVPVALVAARRLDDGAGPAPAPSPLYIHPPRAARPVNRGALRP